jgi:hypothetical protein
MHYEQVIPAPWVKGQHCGVCGNFDGNTKNEMLDKVVDLMTLMTIIDSMTMMTFSEGPAR